MKPELKEKILAYNKAIQEKGAKAKDLDILLGELIKLPPGQLKKILTQEVLNVLSKYGYDKEAV